MRKIARHWRGRATRAAERADLIERMIASGRLKVLEPAEVERIAAARGERAASRDELTRARAEALSRLAETD